MSNQEAPLNSSYSIDTARQLEVLRWMMYAWDGQWLGRTTAVYGPSEAGKLNVRVRTAFAKIEMKSLLALVGKKEADGLADAAEMLKAYFGLAFGERGFEGRFRPVEAAASGGTRLQVEVTRLTALDSLKKVARSAGEDPVQASELLWNTWLETLLPEAQIQVTVRAAGAGEVYQIDSLAEEFAAPPGFDNPAPLRTDHRWTGATPQEYDFNTAPETELSPIAELLQIPLEKVVPASGQPAPFPPFNDPYAGGPASFTPPAPVGPAQPAPAPGSALIGGGEPGAQTNLQQGRSGLSNRLAALNAEAAGAAPVSPAPAPETPGPDWAAGQSQPLPTIGIDPADGRPLFSSDLEAEARQKVEREKMKNPPLMSRLFMSKQAREMIANSPTPPAVQASSLAANIDLLLQRRLMTARPEQPGLYPEPLRVVGGPEGELQIVVGTRVYQSVDEVPPGPVSDIIRQAVAEWSQSQQ